MPCKGCGKPGEPLTRECRDEILEVAKKIDDTHDILNMPDVCFEFLVGTLRAMHPRRIGLVRSTTPAVTPVDPQG